ncbi:hybrid sensor histidine kinase/response regulator [bacterium]|nr:MAG: hybrid sensor histidine kinase/response regulator [bacterium]
MSIQTVKFLLVDDVEENLLALEALLRRDGLELIKARSGPEALELLLAHEFALALLDVQMPGMDGFELAELMRGTERTKSIPIVFLTAGGFDEQRRFRGYGAGAVDFLFKPIEPEILKSKADVFYELYIKRQEAIKQSESLREALAKNAELVASVQRLNESLERSVEERTAQLLEANEQLQGFTYSVAHDFRQHIRGINTNASMILEEAGPSLGEHRKSLERIGQVACRMGQMTDDLLNYARFRSETLRPVELDLTEMALEATETYQSLYPHARCCVAPGLTVSGDRTLVRILLDNLLDNAFKYSQEAPYPLVEVGRANDAFFVRDNGSGFDMAYAHKLFLPFERLHSDDALGGTGIGLANVRRIVQRHGGKIWATAAVGAGSTFFFTLKGDEGD